MDAKVLRQLEREIEEVLIKDYPHLLPRAPSFRYWAMGNRAYCWTTEPARDSKGSMRYASFVSRLSKDHITPLKSTRRDHAKRKDAKARALSLFHGAK